MSFVNPVQVSPDTVQRIAQAHPQALTVQQLTQVDESAFVIDQLLGSDEVAAMRQDLETHEWIPVGLDGILANYKRGEPVGSYRASVHNEPLANALWKRLEPVFCERLFDEMARTDWDGHARWRPVGINPLLRMIRYQHAGLLVPHYDAPYIENDERRTLVTLVIYLACDSDVVGGATRFIRDNQLDIPFADRDHSDWTRLANEDEIIAQVEPRPGSALVFDHRLLHDSQPLQSMQGGCKMILRTDVMYERA